MKAHFSMMARYNAWANARLYAAAHGLPDAAYRKNVGAFFGSLHGTLNHLLVADRIWMRRLTGTGEQPDKLNAILYDELPALEQARTEEDERILGYVSTLREEDFDQDVDYATTKGVAQRSQRGEILAHLFNHQTHHRGQAHAILTVLGIKEPQALDLIAMLRDAR